MNLQTYLYRVIPGLFGTLLGLCALLGLSGSVWAEDFVPSVTGREPIVIEAVDADGNDVTDELVITPYVYRQEMQNDKIDFFDEAYGKLTWEMIGKVLGPTLEEGMNPRNLMVERLYYVHERNNSGIVKLPVTIRISTGISAKEYCQVITYWENGPGHSAPRPHSVKRAPGVHEWYRINSTNNGDGTITLVADHYGPYATVYYRVKEQAAQPQPADQIGEQESGETLPTSDSAVPHPSIPRSPQTGEPLRIWYWLAIPALVYGGKRWASRN